jgi:hypothetical protein
MFFLFDQNGVYQQVAGYGSTQGIPVTLEGVSTVAGANYYLGVINMGGSAGANFDFTYSISSTTAETPITTFGEYIPGALAPNQTVTYTFDSLPGHVYAISWDDSYRGSGAYTADLMVAASGAISPTLMFNTDSGYRGFHASSGYIIDYHQLMYTSASGSEKVSIMVSEYSPGYTSGTFGLKVTDVSSGVLIIGDGATENTIVPALQGAGYQNVTTVSRSAFDGSQLGGNAEVILIGGNDYSTDMSAAGQSALLSFVNTGGNLLFTEWIAYQMGNGQFATLAPLLLAPRDPAIGGFETADTYTVVVQHPITQGLPNSFVTPAMGSNIVTSYAGVALMAGTTSGYPVITAGYGGGRVVQYANAGNYGGYNPFVDPNMNLLLQNTADWLTR